MTNSNGALEDATPTTTKPVRGQISAIAAQADLSLGVIDEARRLVTVASAQGITTTVPSLASAIHLRKRKANDHRADVVKKPKKLLSGRALDDAVESIETLRAYIERLEAKNGDLELKLTQLQTILKR